MHARISTLIFLLALILVFMFGPAPARATQITVNTFEGIDASEIPGAGLGVDPNGAVGTKQYMEWVNPVYQAFDKSGNPVTPVTAGDTPWRQNNMPDCYGAGGNVQLNFDHLASRWVIGRRQGAGTYFYCIAVSNTDDVAASGFKWYTYELPMNSVLGQNAHGHTFYPDYPKIGTWQDGYYVALDMLDPDASFAIVGVVACAFDRTTMLTGGTMRPPQCFRDLSSPEQVILSHSLEPADIDGTTAPIPGLPEFFASLENPATGQNSANVVNKWTFKVNWTNPSQSSFTGPVTYKVLPYTQGCFTPTNPINTICVPEPSSAQTKNYIDSVGDRLMQRLSFRRFTGSSPYESWLIATTVQVGSGIETQTGIRFWEFRDNGQGKTGTISFPDGNYRFMPSAAQDKAANMAVGYSISGVNLHPSIAVSYLNLRTAGGPTEQLLWSGLADEENSYHWGVYTSMTIDPTDDCTFWYVNEYYDTTQVSSPTWQTRISNFKLPSCQ